jgi:predicted nucleotidyltransferase
MTEFGLSVRETEIIKSILQKYPQIERAVIFGSRAMNTFKPGSDVDIALWGKNIDGTLLNILDNEFEESMLPYFVDLLDFKNIKNQALKQHIQRVGKIFYQKTTQ